jgi:hypothetical protein
MSSDGTTTTSGSAALDTSAVAPGVGGATSTPVPAAGATSADSEQRIAGLMSLFNKEQNERQKGDAEAARLQGLLATAVASETTLRQKLVDVDTGRDQTVRAIEERATSANSKVAELQQELARLAAENTRLGFLVKNADLAQYADILPTSSDITALERAATTIRAARDTELGKMRDHLTGGTESRGGQIPRAGSGAMTAAQIADYLRAAPPGEFETRFAEVTGRTK